MRMGFRHGGRNWLILSFTTQTRVRDLHAFIVQDLALRDNFGNSLSVANVKSDKTEFAVRKSSIFKKLCDS